MHIVSWGDDLHEMTTPIFWGNKKSMVVQNLLNFFPKVLRVIIIIFFVVCNSFALKAPFSSKIDIFFYPRKV